MARDSLLDRLHLAHFYRNVARAFRSPGAAIRSATSGACLAREIGSDKIDIKRLIAR